MNLENISVKAGLLYLALIIPGILAFLLIPDIILSEANPVQYMQDNLWIIFAWIGLDILIILIEVYLTIYLKKLFDEHNKELSMVAFITRWLVILIMFVNVLFLVTLLLTNKDSAIDYVQLHLDGTYLWQIPFSVHVFVLGYMLKRHLKSIWQYLGFILMLGALGYLLDTIQYFYITEHALFSSLVSLLLVFVTLAEIGMAFALIRKKVL